MFIKPRHDLRLLGVLLLACAGHVGHAAQPGIVNIDIPAATQGSLDNLKKCLPISTAIQANGAKIQQALFDHYGDSERKVKLGHNNGDYDFMRLREVGVIKSVGGSCNLRYEARSQKFDKGFDGQVGVAPPKPERKRDGEVEWEIRFNPADGAKLCVMGQSIKHVNWRSEGAVKEKIFINKNGKKKYFSGCLL